MYSSSTGASALGRHSPRLTVVGPDVILMQWPESEHEPSLSHNRPRFGCRLGTFSPSCLQIRSTRLWFTSQPSIRSRFVICRYPYLPNRLANRITSVRTRRQVASSPGASRLTQYVTRVTFTRPESLTYMHHAPASGLRSFPWSLPPDQLRQVRHRSSRALQLLEASSLILSPRPPPVVRLGSPTPGSPRHRFAVRQINVMTCVCLPTHSDLLPSVTKGIVTSTSGFSGSSSGSTT